MENLFNKMIKLKVEDYKKKKKELIKLINKTPEVVVKENSFFKTDEVLGDNVPRYYIDFLFKDVLRDSICKFTGGMGHKESGVRRVYKAKFNKDSFMEWHVSPDQGHYECFFAVETKGIEINYLNNSTFENEKIVLNEGEIVFISTHCPRAIEKVKNLSKLIVFYLDIYEYTPSVSSLNYL